MDKLLRGGTKIWGSLIFCLFMTGTFSCSSSSVHMFCVSGVTFLFFPCGQRAYRDGNTMSLGRFPLYFIVRIYSLTITAVVTSYLFLRRNHRYHKGLIRSILVYTIVYLFLLFFLLFNPSLCQTFGIQNTKEYTRYLYDSLSFDRSKKTPTSEYVSMSRFS